MYTHICAYNISLLIFLLHPTSISSLNFSKFTAGKVKWLVWVCGKLAKMFPIPSLDYLPSLLCSCNCLHPYHRM